MSKNPVLGYWTCELGGKAEVTQTVKAGRHFNTKCECCGFVQGTGKARQQKIYDQTQWLDGAVYVRPANVEETAQKPAIDPEESEKVTEDQPNEATQQADFDPNSSESNEQTISEQSTEPSENSGVFKRFVLPGAVIVASIIAGVMNG